MKIMHIPSLVFGLGILLETPDGSAGRMKGTRRLYAWNSILCFSCRSFSSLLANKRYNEGPWLQDEEDGVAQAGYKFVRNFYYSALNGNSLYAALNYASYAVWNKYFFESPYSPFLPQLHHLMIYGDTGLVLP
jgi:hypothetical protein